MGGYLTCTEEGLCDRICGDQCKDGSVPADCPIDPCSNRKLCPGAVSCSPDICGGTCKAVYFGADGSVLDNCEFVEDDQSIAKASPPNAEPATPTDSEPADEAPANATPADEAPSVTAT